MLATGMPSSRCSGCLALCRTLPSVGQSGWYLQIWTPVGDDSADGRRNRRASPSVGNNVFPPPSVIGSMIESNGLRVRALSTRARGGQAAVA